MKHQKYSHFLYFAFVAVILAGIGFSCSKSSGGASSGNSGTGSDSILLNIGNNIILPGYQALATGVNSLDSAIRDFNSGPDPAKLANVQVIFKNAYIAWQSASQYDYFGPAYTAQPVLSAINIFPTRADLIDSNIVANDDNVNSFANTAAKGFPALDY